MSILIKGMKMPTNCDNCLFDNNIWCLLNPKSAGMIYDIADGKPEWCPLVPVPPHGRLIDADAFAADIIKIIESHNYDDYYAESFSVGAILREVVSELNGTSLQGCNNAPTIIEADEGE